MLRRLGRAIMILLGASIGFVIGFLLFFDLTTAEKWALGIGIAVISAVLWDLRRPRAH